MSVDSRPRSARRLRTAGLAVLALLAGNALSLPGRRMLGHYDFGYAIRGDRAARPAQVFDDGAGKVFFEVRPGQPMPAIFVGHAPELVVAQPEGQYFTVRTSETEFTLAVGAARATVRRGDAALEPEAVTWREDDGRRLLASADPGLPQGVEFDPARLAAGRVAWHEQPIVFRPGSALLRPEVLDALGALVVRVGRDTTIAVTGRNDAGESDDLSRRRAEALRNALLARGVPARNIDIASSDTGTHSRASTLGWRGAREDAAVAADSPYEIRTSDADVAAALRRWALADGYEVIWDLPWAAPAARALRVDAPDFLDAVRQVVTGLRAQGRAVQAQAYSDRVVRISAAP